jgi:RHS repeat-associated protein
VDFDLNDVVAEPDRNRIKTTYFTVLAEQSALHAYLRTDNGISQTDNKSSLYDVGIGIVGSSKFVKLEASLDGLAYQDVTANIVSFDDKAIIQQSVMDGLAGGAVSIGVHRLDVRASDASNLVCAVESLSFERVKSAPQGRISGSLFVGMGNAVVGDSPAAGRTVFIDDNSNSIRDSGERFTKSDSEGKYEFLGLTAGQYKLYQELPNAWIQTFPASTGSGGGDGWADYIANYSAAGNGPFAEPYGRPFGGALNQSVNPADIILGPTPGGVLSSTAGPVDFLSIPRGSSVTVGFSDEEIIDGSGDDIFIQTLVDHANEHANVYVGKDLETMVFVKQIGEGGSAGIDLSEINYQGKVTLVKIEGVDNLGAAPGFDLISVHALSRVNVPKSFQFVELADSSSVKTGVNFGSSGVDAPPEVALSITSSKINVGDRFTVRMTVRDDVGITSSVLTQNGNRIALDSSGYYNSLANTKGALVFFATVTDTKGQTATSRAEIIVDDPSNPDVPGNGTVTGPGGEIGTGSGPFPLVEITAPNGAVGEDLGKFIGTVNPNGGTLANWRLDYAPQASVDLTNLIGPVVSWTAIASGTDVKNNASLGNIDTTLLANNTFVFRLLAYNTNGRGAVTTVIFNPRDTAIPKIAFTAPVVGSEISYQTEIRATIDPDGGTIDRWILDYAQAAEVSLELLSDPSVKWTEMARGNTAKSNAAIGTLDATMLRNDSYVLRIRAWNTNGRGYQLGGIFNVTGQSKLGNFRVQFTDLSIPLQGIPIQVTRIYDSLETGRFNDFGYGWSLALGDADIRETVPDTGGDIFTAAPFKIGTRVYLTTPEGKRVGFTFKLRNPQSSFFFTTWEAYFEPDRGVYEKLSLGPADNTRVSQVSNGSVVYPLFQFGFNPNDYLLTLQNGTVYHYDQKQGLKDVTDLNGNTATFTDSGIRHSSGVAIDFVRDAQGRITAIKAPNGTQVGYAYDAKGDLIDVTNQLGAKTSFGYYATPAHYLEKIANPNDLAQGKFTQRILYDANGRVSQVQDGAGNVVAKQDFVPGSFTGTRTDGRGFVTNLTYERRGNLLSEQSPEGGITRYEYSDPANPDKETAIIDPLTHRREFTYDSQGNKVTEKDPLSNLTIYGYNSIGKITSLTKKNAANVTLSTESAEYDADGNLTKLINCAGDSRTFAYVSGRLVGSTDFEGNATIYDYTNGCPCGSPSKVIYPDGTTKLFEYNAYGQVTKVTDETGAISRFIYDAIGRKTQEIDHDAKATVFDYDDNNNLVKRTDRLGRISKFEYNAKNLLVKEIKILTDNGNDTDDVILSYEYDEDDRLEALVDPMANRTEFAYDRDGRLSTRKDAAGKSSQVFYDLAGNTKTVVDRNGSKRSFAYDVRNLPTEEFWHAPNDSIVRTISIGYDDLGRRASISDPDSAYGFTYDACSRVQTETNAGTPLMPSVGFTYGYDKDGHRTSVTDNAGVSVVTSFDSRGRSDRFKWQGGGIAAASVDLDRNGRGQMTAIKRFNDGNLGNIVSQTTYDQIAPQGWVKQVQHKNNLGNLYNSGSNFTYGYDAEGQVTTQASQGNSTIYSYDLTGQLTGANHTAAAYPDESYQYDKAGNRISSHLHASYTTGTANRLQSDGQFSYSYDDEGNTTTKTEIATGKVTSYIYDHRGRVTSLTERASVGGAITSEQSFTHDVLDRRIGIVANGVTTRISYLDENAWADYNAAGVATKRYLFADRIDGNLANWTATNGTQWYLTDKLGSTRALASSGGALGTNVGYDSFGNNLTGSGIFAAERLGFTGRENVAAGTMFYRSRFYNSGAGRFVGEDRIEFEGGDWNLYRYAVNKPQNFIDPTGRGPLIEYAKLLITVESITV